MSLTACVQTQIESSGFSEFQFISINK